MIFASDNDSRVKFYCIDYTGDDNANVDDSICQPTTRKYDNVKDFFADPRHASCHGLVLRDAANLFFGRKFPNGGRLINYAILRPEWIVDVRPVAGSPDLLGRARRDPRTSLARIRKLLVTSDGELTKARAAETRRLKREGLDSTAMETRSVYDDGLDYILNGLAGKRQRS